MQADFWHQRWQENQIGFHLSEVNPHLRAYWQRVAVPPGAPVFVPLCGKTLDMAWLAGQGHPVLGVELSPIALEQFCAEQGIAAAPRSEGRFRIWESQGLRLLCGDFFDLTADHLAGVRAVWDRASLVALTPELRQRYARHLLQILPAEAAILLVIFDYPQHQMDGPPFSVGEEEVHSLYGDAMSIETLHTRDVLPESPQFAARGVTRLEEKVLLLRPR